MLTKTICVYSNRCASLVVNQIMCDSQWFDVEPLPDDWYNITVKTEYHARIVNKVKKTFGICYDKPKDFKIMVKRQNAKT